MQLNSTQFEKLSGYFIDLAKVWFASGVIGFFASGYSGSVSVGIAIMSIGISALFLIIGLKLLSGK